MIPVLGGNRRRPRVVEPQRAAASTDSGTSQIDEDDLRQAFVAGLARYLEQPSMRQHMREGGLSDGLELRQAEVGTGFFQLEEKAVEALETLGAVETCGFMLRVHPAYVEMALSSDSTEVRREAQRHQQATDRNAASSRPLVESVPSRGRWSTLTSIVVAALSAALAAMWKLTFHLQVLVRGEGRGGEPSVADGRALAIAARSSVAGAHSGTEPTRVRGRGARQRLGRLSRLAETFLAIVATVVAAQPPCLDAARRALPRAADHPAARRALPGAADHPATHRALPGAADHPAARRALPRAEYHPAARRAFLCAEDHPAAHRALPRAEDHDRGLARRSVRAWSMPPLLIGSCTCAMCARLCAWPFGRVTPGLL